MSETTTHGEIFSETLPTLLHGHHERAETGTLTLRQGSVTKTLRLHRGGVVFAGSNERDDRLIQLLVRRGTVSLPDLIRALEVSLKDKRRLGAILLAQKKISPADLERALQEQLKDIVCSLFAWTSGVWQFEAGDPPAESVTLKVHPLALILEGIRRIESWARAYEVVGGMNTEYLATREAEGLAKKAELLPGEQQILNFCQESRSLNEICEVVPLNDFVVTKVVWGLLAVGALMKA
ncbi:MAG: DUF4388 domain-containing protein [Acidobacteria bacterium]|nr:DUF4388 domain-containing protein [Acidobacteriota bacterium]